MNALNEPQRKALIRFWEAWQEELKRLRILDLACGSGAILIEAFNQLHAVYELSNARLEELRGQRTLFDLDRQILQHNLYGVDLNAEAIQICQLSLWIKTAARGKQLTSLDYPKTTPRRLPGAGWHDWPGALGLPMFWASAERRA
jgi:SAM-dependent methyltransferase